MGTVGGSGVPNRRRVTPVGNVAPVGAVPSDVVVVVVGGVVDVMLAAVAHVVCAPLPSGGIFALVSLPSSWPMSDGFRSSSVRFRKVYLKHHLSLPVLKL